nr:FAD-dependent oxidoreductase [Streptomyces purpurogeneiscleroticus]
MCLCNGVSRRQLAAAWQAGARSVADLAAATRATTGCGGCESDVRNVVERLAGSAPPPAPAPAVRRTRTASPRTLVVVGNGMAGHRLVATLRSRDLADQWRIVVLGKEHRPAYDRVSLSSYLDGKSAEDLTLAGADLLADPMVGFRLGVSGEAVDPAARTVRTSEGDSVGYDALVLATGSHPFVPPVPGREAAGCFVYRTFEDLDAIRAAAAPGRPCVVVGGGVLGLEAASALRNLGMRPHVVERAPYIMAAQLDEAESLSLARELEGLGLRLYCGTGLSRIAARPDGRVGSVELGDGRVLEADLVVFAAGIIPADGLAGPAGLARGERGGFLVDRRCRTADPRIWAVGECAAVAGRCHGLAAPGYRMADMVARHLLGESVPEFTDSDNSPPLKLVGAALAATG